MTEPECRLYGLIARTRRVGVIFRRGPSKHVHLIRWWLDGDRFEFGQWFNGRIYERRCDLSPDGELLVYFAQNFARAPGSWTAISRPPYLTALAMWPKGDCWGGGGLFDSQARLQLNHWPGDQMNVDPRFKLPRWFRVLPLGEHSGRGEDEPICELRHTRDGWQPIQSGMQHRANQSAPVGYPFDPPRIDARSQPRNPKRVLLRITRGINVRQGPWYQEDYALTNAEACRQFDNTAPSLQSLCNRYSEQVDWADWDSNGDLLIAKYGRLYRLAKNAIRKWAPTLLDGATQIADFRDLRFTTKTAPLAARQW